MAITNVFVGGAFLHNGDKKIGTNMEFISFYCKFERKGQKMKKLANLLGQHNNLK
jgi:hypothetical protein